MMQNNWQPLLCQPLSAHLHVLADGAEIRRQPVRDDDDAALLCRVEWALLEKLRHAALRGDGPEGEGWLVDVEDPRDASRVLVTLRLRGGAIATSASNRRSWRRGTARMHHLINPRTGAPAETDLAQATVLAETAERADVLAKVAFVLGSSDGATFLRQVGASGVLVKRDGRVLDVGRLEVCDA